MSQATETSRSADKIGVLLVNLGTPTAPTAAAVKPYLREFLSDRRVVELPALLWQPILNGIILNTRPRASAEKYASIWLADGSPLDVYTREQTRLLAGALATRGHDGLVVDYAMRYGEPAIRSTIARLQALGVDRLLVLPLYPQYCAATTATVWDEVCRLMLTLRDIPALRLVKHYGDDPGYIDALAHGIDAYWSEHGRPDVLVTSFHGMPRRTRELGDPYYDECQDTARRLATALGLADDQWRCTFQSRFGRAEWLQPYTAATLEQLGRDGVGRVDVACPGFVADCVETLEEIGIEGKQIFLDAGGKVFHAIPCLNDSPAWIAALADLTTRELGGWLPAA